MTGQTAPNRSANLPNPLSPLIGREREIADLQAIVVAGDQRLVTLTGPGGVGKSRLAIEVARALVDQFGENLAFVSLAHIHDPDEVLPAIAQSIDVRETGSEPLSDAVEAALSAQSFLLVLDNMEQVVESADILARLLHHCPGLTIIATSQVRLRISGEREFAVQTLAFDETTDPRAGDLNLQPDAVRLFVDRARAMQESFALTPDNITAVRGICLALDGLPLAIELAAARIKILSPDALLDRLDQRLSILTGGGRDLPHRQQTMRNAIQWSYELLTDDEQALLRRLSVFSGGFTLHAVLQTGNPDTDLDLVSSLADKSLIKRLDTGNAEPRYFMFETIREFGHEQLERRGESTEARQQHGAFFLAESRRARLEWIGEKAHRWVSTMDADLANIRTAFTWFQSVEDLASGLMMAASLDWYWDASLAYREGRTWIERFLPAVDSIPREMQVYALRCAAFLNMRLQDLPVALGYAEMSLQTAREIGTPRTLIDALSGAGAVNAESGQYEKSTEFYSEMLELSRREDYQRGVAVSTHNMGLVAFASGDLERARRLHEEALDLDRKAGNRFSLLNCLNSLSMVLIQSGDIHLAATYMQEQLDIAQEDGIEVGVALYALVATYNGQFVEAAQILGANAAAAEQVGSRLYGSSLANRVFDPVMETLQDALGEAEMARQLAIGRELDYRGQYEIAREIVAVVLTQETTAPPVAVEQVVTPSHDLSPRELEVLRELAKGGTNQAIADSLYISVPTVKVHVRSILTKLNLSSRTAAAAWAITNGLN